jgi:hypothetical protein
MSSLRLRAPAPPSASGAPSQQRGVVALNVFVFRVDSLEEEPIGHAVLVERWQWPA